MLETNFLIEEQYRPISLVAKTWLLMLVINLEITYFSSQNIGS